MVLASRPTKPWVLAVALAVAAFVPALAAGAPPMLGLVLLGAWLLPGVALARLGGMGDPTRQPLAAGFVLAAPLVLHGIGATLLGPVGLGPIPLLALPAAVAVVVSRRRHTKGAVPGAAGKWAAGAVAAALALLLLLATAPPHHDLQSDALAHVAAVRASAEEGAVFPVREFHGDQEIPGADPRFGTIHAFLAGCALAAGASPLQAWDSFAPLAGALQALALMALGAALFSHPLAGWAFVLAWLGGFGGGWYDVLAIAGYPMWTGLSCIYLALALALQGRPRLAALGIGSLCFHVMAGLLGGYHLLLAWLAAGRPRRPWGVALLAGAAVALPLLAIRFAVGYASANPIHERPWQLMELAGGLVVASPVHVLVWLWPLGLAGLALLVLAAWRGSRGFATRLGLWLCLPSLAWMMTPWLMGPSVELLGFLPLRLTMAVLFPLGFGVAVDHAMAHGRRRDYAVAVLLVAAAGLATADRLASRLEDPGPQLVDSDAWSRLVESLHEEAPEGRSLLSDPFTMMAVRATSAWPVVAVPDGRSSPRDSLAIQRLRDSWRAMTPQLPMATSLQAMDRQGVAMVLLAHHPDGARHSYEYSVVPSTFEEQRERFLARPELFEPVLDLDDLLLLRRRETRTEAGGSGANPRCLQPAPAGPGEPLRDGYSIHAAPLRVAGEGTLVARAQLAHPAPGEAPHRHLVVRADWIAPEGRVPWWYGRKPLRKLAELIHGQRYRARWTRWPVGGRCPTWVLGERDALPLEMVLSLPPGLAPGEYRLHLQVSDLTEFTVLRPRDLWLEDDIYSGPTLGRFRVDSAGRIAPAGGP